MAWYYWLLVVAVGMFLFDRLFLFLEERGYVYWRKKKHSSSSSNVLVSIDALFNPASKHVIEQLVKEEAFVKEEDEEGDKKR